MTTFNLIIQKVLKIENKKFFNYTDDNIDPLLKVIFGFGFDINDTSKPIHVKKMNFLKDSLNNFFIKMHIQEEFLSYFNKIQRTYHALNRFVFNYKFKKAQIIVKTDMILNDLKEDDKNVLCIYQDNSRYLFKIYDLLKIINMSLINSQEFFAEPLCIKNPYNNLPFEKSILYYIHYYLTEKTKISSKLIHTDLFLKFHSCHFNLNIFLNKYEHLLREEAVVNYVKNSVNNTLYSLIIHMLVTFNYSKNNKYKIVINNRFPKEKVITILKPYLVLFMNSRYLLVPNLKNKALDDLHKKLKAFQIYNPLFGRVKLIYGYKICSDGVNKKIKVSEEINDKHINFYTYDNDNFLKDHLTYKNTHYSDANNFYRRNENIYYIDEPENNDNNNNNNGNNDNNTNSDYDSDNNDTNDTNTDYDSDSYDDSVD